MARVLEAPAPTTPSSRDERFLVLAPTGRDGPLTAALLEGAGLCAVVCVDGRQACDEVRLGAAALLVADEALTAANVRLLAVLVAEQPPWSDIPIVVFTGRGATVRDRQPTDELLAPLGNVTLLERPLRPSTMLSVARAALRARRRQYASRGVLDQQRRAVEERDQFLAMLGHELRNPLGVILLAAEMLGRTDRVEPQRSVIRRQGKHLARLVDDLLDVARVTRGKIVLQPELVDLDDLVDRCARSVAALRPEGPSIEARRAGRPAPVRGDAVRLEQVFTNLVANAAKYTPDGGHVVVECAVEAAEVVVTVLDDGIGISAEMLPRIFDLFAQAHATLDRSQGGLGIGLTLVRQLVELHHGRVTAESAGVGQGSRFTVRLPLAEIGVTFGPKVVAGPAPTRSREVLVVEDNPDTRAMLATLLEAHGHRVRVAADGAEGLARALEAPPEVMVVDIGLPRMDGYAVARRIREDLGREVLLIALTGYGQPEDRARAAEAGFDVHCTKPVTPERLIGLLNGA